MKYRITLILSLLYALNILVRKTKDPRYIQYAGGYGSNDGVYLFDDGTFILYGYATAVFGEYKFDKMYCFSIRKNENCLRYMLHKINP